MRWSARARVPTIRFARERNRPVRALTAVFDLRQEEDCVLFRSGVAEGALFRDLLLEQASRDVEVIGERFADAACIAQAIAEPG
jgi:hypothetical protein